MKNNLKQKEFELIKNNVYYFDWHILSYLKNPNKI